MQGNTEKAALTRLIYLHEKYPIAIGYQKITVDGTAVGFTIPEETTSALCVVESTATGIAVRFKEHGTPTTTDGVGRSNTDAFEIIGPQNLLQFKIVQAQSGTHTLHVTYYK